MKINEIKGKIFKQDSSERGLAIDEFFHVLLI
jgi:hypothetical protein